MTQNIDLSQTSGQASQALNNRQLARAATLIMLALVASGILGLIRQGAIASAFGAGRQLDAFNAALRVPETLFVLVAGGALGSAFIPVFTRFLATNDSDGAWRLASTVLTLVTLAAVMLSVVMFIFAEGVVKTILVPDAPADSQRLTAELMRMMLVTVVIFGGSGLVMGILNSHQHFLMPALAPSMYNLGLIFGAVALAPSMGVQGLAWGAVLGALFHLGVQLPVLRRLESMSIRPSTNLKTEGVTEVLFLMLPRVLGLGVVQVNFWVNAALTSGMMAGSLTALQTAFTLMFTILGILGQSVGTAVFPTLSRLHSEGNDIAFAETLIHALTSVLFLSLPAGFGLAVLSDPIVTVLFERGEWTATDTDGTAWALTLFGVGLAGHAALEILARAFYALHDTWTPVKVGGATMLLNIFLSLMFIQLWGEDTNFARGAFGGLALAMSISTALESMLLWFLLQRRLPMLKVKIVSQKMLKMTAAALCMALIVAGWQRIGQGFPTLLLLIGGIGLGGASFFGAALLFKLDEARLVPQLVRSRFRRSRQS